MLHSLVSINKGLSQAAWHLEMKKKQAEDWIIKGKRTPAFLGEPRDVTESSIAFSWMKLEI